MILLFTRHTANQNNGTGIIETIYGKCIQAEQGQQAVDGVNLFPPYRFDSVGCEIFLLNGGLLEQGAKRVINRSRFPLKHGVKVNSVQRLDKR